MPRRLALAAAAFGLLFHSAGCRTGCGERRGLFGLRSGHADASGGYLASGSRSPGIVEADCSPVPGTLTGLQPYGGAGIPVLPAPGTIGPGRSDELPYPQPNTNDLIPRQGVPFAPPSPAPSDGSMGSVGGPLKAGTPVKNP